MTGREITRESLQELPDEQLEQTFNVNILAMVRVTRQALEHLRPGSTIINTTSIQAYQPSPTLLDYASTKAAINNFSKGLAQQLAPTGIRVNAVAPGPIWTALQVSDGQPTEALSQFGQSTALGRAGQPTELVPRTSCSPRRSPATSSAKPSTSTAASPPPDRLRHALTGRARARRMVNPGPGS